MYSTASDLAALCQMMLNGGTFKGRRILSEMSVAADDAESHAQHKVRSHPNAGISEGSAGAWPAIR